MDCFRGQVSKASGDASDVDNIVRNWKTDTTQKYLFIMGPSRKRDWAYIIFFATHIPIIYLIDTFPLQPAWLQSSLSPPIREFYVNTYRDKFFEDAPIWFQAFMWMELLYHVPLSLWAVWALLKGMHHFLSLPTMFSLFTDTVVDHAFVPIHLLGFGVQVAVTTIACLTTVWSWEDRTLEEKTNITSLYGPYIALGK